MISGCASSQLTVESDPAGADIYAVTGSGVKQKLGQTPMTFTPALQPGLFAPDTQLKVLKEGYHSESFLIPPQASGATTRIQAKLAEDPITKACQDSSNALTDATDAVARVQRLIYAKNYNEAEKALSGYIVKFSTVPVFQSLLGNVYYLQRNLDRALDSYRRAKLLQPQNFENSRMIEKINGIRGPTAGGT